MRFKTIEDSNAYLFDMRVTEAVERIEQIRKRYAGISTRFDNLCDLIAVTDDQDELSELNDEARQIVFDRRALRKELATYGMHS